MIRSPKPMKYTPQMLREAVASSSSLAGVLRKLGLRPGGGSQAAISKRIAEHNLDTGHFTSRFGHPSPKEAIQFRAVLSANPELRLRLRETPTEKHLNARPAAKLAIRSTCPRCSQEETYAITRLHKNPDAVCRVCSSRVLEAGTNDLASLHPHLVEEWSEGNDKAPHQVTAKSDYRAEWVCNSHPLHPKWVSPVSARANGRGCPSCGRFRGKSKPEYQLPDGVMVPLEMQRAFVSAVATASNPNAEPPGFQSLIHLCRWRCAEGHEWEEVPRKLADRGEPCPTCAKLKAERGAAGLEAPRHRVEASESLAHLRPDIASEWDAEANKWGPQLYSLKSAYEASWVCTEGHKWSIVVYARTSKKGSGCPHCMKNRMYSMKEKALQESLREKLPADTEIHVNDRAAISPKELDLYFPRQRIAVEFNGVHWHSEEKGKDRHWHRNKVDACRDAGIQLIQVWEDDWDRAPDLIVDMILHKLGVATRPRIPARKCSIAALSIAEARSFLNAHHIQGYATGAHYLALQHEGETVACLVLKGATGADKGMLDITRYATSKTVVGGFTRLLKYAERTIATRGFLTFSDYEVSDGALYRDNGFVATKELRPDYKYAVKGKRVHKFNYRLKRFISDPELVYDATLSERDLARLNKIPRVWDSGKTKWVKLLAKKD